MERDDKCSSCTQRRMAAGNKFRHAQRSLPRVKQIPGRFKSERKERLFLQVS